MKRAIQSALRLGAESIKIVSGGRLGGAEIARIEWYREGRVPLRFFRADIDYGVSTSHTAYGTIGIKSGFIRRKLRYKMRTQISILLPTKAKVNKDNVISRKTKYRKAHKGRIHGIAKGYFKLWSFGQNTSARKIICKTN